MPLQHLGFLVPVLFTIGLIAASKNRLPATLAMSTQILASRAQAFELVSDAQLHAQARTLSLEKVISLPGLFMGFTADGTGLITSSQQENQSWIFDLEGIEQASIPGIVIGFSADDRTLVLISEEQLTSQGIFNRAGLTRLQNVLGRFMPNDTKFLIYGKTESHFRLFDFEGNEIATFLGRFYEFTPDRQGVVTYTSTDNLRRGTFRLFTLEGAELATFPGGPEGWQFMPDGQRVITCMVNQSWLFDLQGVEQLEFAGCPMHILPDGETLVIYSREDNTSRLIHSSGEEVAAFPGYFKTFTQDAQQIIAESFERDATRIYAADGTELAVLSGSFRELTPDGEHLITSLSNDDVTRLYTLDGTELATYRGQFGRLWSEQKAIFTYSNEDHKTRVFNFEGEELAALAGGFLLHITPDGEGIVIAVDNYPTSDFRFDLYRVR